MEPIIPSRSIKSLLPLRSSFTDACFFRLESIAPEERTWMTPHRYHAYACILITAGRGKHAIDLLEFELRHGALFLINPGQIHTFLELEEVQGFIILFNEGIWTLSRGKRGITAWSLLQTNHHGTIHLTENIIDLWIDRFEGLAQEFANQDKFTREVLYHTLSLLLVATARLDGVQLQKRIPLPHDFLSSFQELIETHFLTLKTPQEYAEKLNITSNYLNALCRKKSGKTAGELIRQRVLLEAKRLLAHTELSVSEVAFRLNFEDNSYFGRYFKKYTKLTPGEFRQQRTP